MFPARGLLMWEKVEGRKLLLGSEELRPSQWLSSTELGPQALAFGLVTGGLLRGRMLRED